MPVTGGDLLIVLLELTLLLGGREVPHSSSGVRGARDELNRAQREREVSDARVLVGLELILLHDDVVAVKDVPLLVSGNEVFMIIRPAHSLHFV